MAYANNSLAGNGLQELRFLDRDYASVYTKPDITDNRSPFLNFSVRHSLTACWRSLATPTIATLARTRSMATSTKTRSIRRFTSRAPAESRRSLAAAGYTGFPASGANAENTPFPFWRCIGNSLLRTSRPKSVMVRSTVRAREQHNYGASGQLTWFGLPARPEKSIHCGYGIRSRHRRFSTVNAARLSQSGPQRDWGKFFLATA